MKAKSVDRVLAAFVARLGRRARLAGHIERLAAVLDDRHGRTRAIRLRARIDRIVHKIRRDVPPIFVYRPFAIRLGNDRPEALVVSHDLSRSGAPRIAFELARILASGGYRVTVFAPVDGPVRHELVASGATVVVDGGSTQFGSELLAAIGGAVDVAICNTVATRPAVRVLRAKVPVFWYIHEISLVQARLAMDPSLAQDLASPHRLWAGSELAAAPIRSIRPDVRVVPYGLAPIDVDDEAARDDGIVRIAVFASLEPRKGQDLAVAALRELSSADRDRVRLTLFGRTLDAPFVERLRAEAGEPSVRFGGELDAEAYRAALGATDIVLVSSRDDTLPLVSIDALGARRILICTSTTGTAGYLADGVDGFVAAAPTATSIADAISRAIACRSTWPQIGERGAAIHAGVFSMRAFSEVVLDGIRSSAAA